MNRTWFVNSSGSSPGTTNDRSGPLPFRGAKRPPPYCFPVSMRMSSRTSSSMREPLRMMMSCLPTKEPEKENTYNRDRKVSPRLGLLYGVYNLGQFHIPQVPPASASIRTILSILLSCRKKELQSHLSQRGNPRIQRNSQPESNPTHLRIIHNIVN